MWCAGPFCLFSMASRCWVLFPNVIDSLSVFIEYRYNPECRFLIHYCRTHIHSRDWKDIMYGRYNLERDMPQTTQSREGKDVVAQTFTVLVSLVTI